MTAAGNGSGRGEAALVAEDIHKSFGSLQVLKGISLRANDHDVVSILGSSGSGKHKGDVEQRVGRGFCCGSAQTQG